MPRHHRNLWQDDEPHERLRGGRSDIHENGDRGDRPDDHFRSDYGDRGCDHWDTPGPMEQHEGGSLGWDAAAWDDAGGFDAVLFGHLSNSLGPAGGFPPIIVFAIDDLDVEFNTLIQTTQVQNTLVFLNAANGGSIDIGGDVNANGLQLASTEQSSGFLNHSEFS
ncbi:hypothetical protein [Microvirga sp. VF16]|uniref:hypothetical protein n=1 Tax=Microvirga sp. VF16 TaxID=2807101 RepID=UPI00193CE404|nr:hypothetical protein [Microvirga sp. VF16]QRM27401.1 hypothetical protein JO965_13945 [Microvirga sp. VF16]